MKTAETITTTTQHPPKTGQSFFQKEGGESAFFSEVDSDVQPKPFFDIAHAPFDSGIHAIQPQLNEDPDAWVNGSVEVPAVQTKCAECDPATEEKEEPQVQKKEIFESKDETPLQTKLTVGQPGDPYEVEADAMADQVVQKLSGPRSASNSKEAPDTIQAKCTECEQEEELQKKEADDEEPKIQKKPIFESIAEEPVQTKLNSQVVQAEAQQVVMPLPTTTPPIAAVQAKCTECEQEEKEEEKKEEKMTVQRKKVAFDRNVDPYLKDQFYWGSEWENKEADKIVMFKLLPLVQMSGTSAPTDESAMRKRIVEVAKKEVGKVEAKKTDATGRRVGYERLLEYFHLAAPDEWPDEVIEYNRPGFPSWCGIFSVYTIKKAGIDLGNWQMGKGVSAFNSLQSTDDPQPGDIGYIDPSRQHHNIVIEVNGDTIKTVDGNSGPESGVNEREKNRKDYVGFFTAFTGSEKYIQKKEEDTIASESSDTLDSKLSSSKNQGASLDKSTQENMGSAFGADFSGVRIHTGSMAAEMNNNLNAQAFTHGSDIYFNEGKYNPETSSGKHLLAHELTHTVQQGASKPGVQKSNDKPSETEEIDPTKLPLKDGQMNAAKTEITFESVPVPDFKVKDHRTALYAAAKPLKRMKGYNDGLRPKYESYNKNWLDGIDNATIIGILKDKLGPEFEGDDKTYVFKATLSKSKDTNPYYFGKLNDIANQLKKPVWGGTKATPPFVFMTLDHIVELQLANWNINTESNKINNLELLEDSINTDTGNIIKININERVDRFNKATKNQLAEGASGQEAQQVIKNKYTLVFNDTVRSNRGKRSLKAEDFWTQEQIKKGEQLNPIKAAHINELEEEGKVRVFPKPGARPKTFKWAPGLEEKIESSEKNWFGKYILVTYKHFDTTSTGEDLGYVRVNADPKFLEKYHLVYSGKDILIPIKRLEGSPSVGIVEKASASSVLLDWFKMMSFEPASPVKVDQIDFNALGEIEAQGRIVAELPFIKGTEINFKVENGDIQIFKEFTGPEIQLPSPFKLNRTSLLIFVDSGKGVGINGSVDFSIEKLGEGEVSATLTPNQLSFIGKFNFESDAFEPAFLKVSYVKEFGEGQGEGPTGPKWEIFGKIGLKKQVKGIKKAELDVKYANDTIEGLGSVELDIPAIEGGELKAVYNTSTHDFSITAELQLKKDVPGINGGCLSVTISREGTTGEYTVGIVGSAQPKIPGFKGTNLCIAYKDGIFTVEGKAGFEKGIASGIVKVGVTNRLVKDGVPGGSIGKNLTAYGDGTLTVKFSDFLEGSIGAKITPEGKLILSGKIKTPDEIPLTKGPNPVNKQKDFPRIEFPIPGLGISVLGKSVGVIVYITGNINTYAELSPIMLKKFELGVEGFDPSEPSQAILKGTTEIGVNAKAGLKVTVKAGAQLSLLIAKVGGELDGSVGLELNADAGAKVSVQWTQPKGLELLEANAKAKASAQMFMELGGRLYVDLDLLLKTINLWEHELFRVRKDFGPKINFGVTVPMKIENGKFAGIDFENITFDLPNLNDEKEREKMLSNAMEESGKPPRPDPPGREEVMKTVRKLPARASEGISPFNFYHERYSYIFMLKAKYPEQDWTFIEPELPSIEITEFFNFRDFVFNYKKKFLGFSIVEIRLFMTDKFAEDHKYVDKELIDLLRQEIKDVGEN